MKNKDIVKIDLLGVESLMGIVEIGFFLFVVLLVVFVVFIVFLFRGCGFS